MLEGRLTQEQIQMIMNMIHSAGEKAGPTAYPALGGIVDALSKFRAPEQDDETIDIKE